MRGWIHCQRFTVTSECCIIKPQSSCKCALFFPVNLSAATYSGFATGLVFESKAGEQNGDFVFPDEARC